MVEVPCPLAQAHILDLLQIPTPLFWQSSYDNVKAKHEKAGVASYLLTAHAPGLAGLGRLKTSCDKVFDVQ